MIDGIQCQRGLEAALSKSVPDCTIEGVEERFCSSYQRAASRRAALLEVSATPDVLTEMLCAVHNRPLRTCAAKSRSSSASSWPLVPPVFPRCGTVRGNDVELTVN